MDMTVRVYQQKGEQGRWGVVIYWANRVSYTACQSRQDAIALKQLAQTDTSVRYHLHGVTD